MQTQNASHDLTVTFLLKSDTYPGQPEVKAIETHMSWIFLAGQFAYKMKKTIAYDHLDYRMLEARHHFCEEELRLNRRFSANVYLELVPVTADLQGQLSLHGAGKTVEWLIKMRRLPADRMLDYRFRHYPVFPKEIRKVTELLSRFYLRCTPADISAAQYRQQLMQNIDDTEHALMQFPTLLSQENIRRIGARLRAMVQWQAARFDDRVRHGKIIEGHADLRPEHICLEVDTEPVIFDCLEFSQKLRVLDAADDIGFLALECERMGFPDIGGNILNDYRSLTKDRVPNQLVHFYKAYRAYVRAKIAIWHQREPQYCHSQQWIRQTQQYLALANRHAQAWPEIT